MCSFVWQPPPIAACRADPSLGSQACSCSLCPPVLRWALVTASQGSLGVRRAACCRRAFWNGAGVGRTHPGDPMPRFTLFPAGFGASSSPFGTTSPSPFGQQTPAFGQAASSPFGATTTTGVFGQVRLMGLMALPPSRLLLHWAATWHLKLDGKALSLPLPPTQSQPAFGASPAPAFGAAPAFGQSQPAFGASSAPAFGATSAFGAKPAFGGFGATAASPFGASSTPAFGQSAAAFGASSAPGELACSSLCDCALASKQACCALDTWLCCCCWWCCCCGWPLLACTCMLTSFSPRPAPQRLAPRRLAAALHLAPRSPLLEPPARRLLAPAAHLRLASRT